MAGSAVTAPPIPATGHPAAQPAELGQERAGRRERLTELLSKLEDPIPLFVVNSEALTPEWMQTNLGMILHGAGETFRIGNGRVKFVVPHLLHMTEENVRRYSGEIGA